MLLERKFNIDHIQVYRGDGNTASKSSGELAPGLVELWSAFSVAKANEPIARGGACACLSVMLKVIVGELYLDDLLGAEYEW